MKATPVQRWQCIACKRDHETSTAAERCCTTCRTCRGPQRSQTCARCAAARAVQMHGEHIELRRAMMLAAWARLVRVYPEAADILREEATRRGLIPTITIGNKTFASPVTSTFVPMSVSYTNGKGPT